MDGSVIECVKTWPVDDSVIVFVTFVLDIDKFRVHH